MKQYMKKIWIFLPASLVMILTYQNCDLTRNVTPDLTSKTLNISSIQSFSRALNSGYTAGPVKEYYVDVTLGPSIKLEYNFDDHQNRCSGTISLSTTNKALLENVLDYIRYKELPASDNAIADGAMQNVKFESLNDDIFIFDQLYEIGQPMHVFSRGREELMLFLKSQVHLQDTHMCPSDFDILFN